MADCTDYPTPEDSKRWKNNANSTNEFVTSQNDTFTDQDGGVHNTIEGINTLAETQRDQFDATFQAQFQYVHIGNISDFVGDTLNESEKLNSYQYPDDSDNWYGPIQSQAFPITIPADPTVSGSGWSLVNGASERWVADNFSNTNLLSNHNFIIASPDDSQPAPSATPTSYPPGYEIFSGVFANETTGILNLTYIDGRVSFSGGDFYMSVPNTGALENVTEFVASVADFDGKPRTRGVSYALVGDEYRVTVGVDALEDDSANETLLGSVKFEQGSVATGHEVGAILSHWREMGDVRGWGAVNDGTDSNIAIQKALNSGLSKISFGGGGEYYYSGNLVSPEGVKVIDLEGSSLKGDSGSSFTIAGDNCVVIRGKINDELRTGSDNGILFTGDYCGIAKLSLQGSGQQNSNIRAEGREFTCYKGVFSDAQYMIHGTGSRGIKVTHSFFTGGNVEAVLSANKRFYTTTPVGDAIKLTNRPEDQADPLALGATENIITNNTFDGVYRDACDLFTDGTKTIFSNNIVQNMLSTVLDIKVIYRSDPTQGTSVVNTRQEQSLIAQGNIITNIQAPFADEIAVFAVNQFVNPQTTPDNPTPVASEGVKKVIISGNILDNIYCLALSVKDCQQISYHHNDHYNVVNKVVRIRSAGATYNIDVDDNKLYYANGFDADSGAPVVVMERVSATHQQGSFNRNEIYCAKSDGNTGGTAIFCNGESCHNDFNVIEGFSVGVDFYGGNNSAIGNKLKGANQAVRVGHFGATSGAIVTGNYSFGSSATVAVNTTNTTSIIMHTNDAVNPTGTAFSDISSIANKIEYQNNEMTI